MPEYVIQVPTTNGWFWYGDASTLAEAAAICKQKSDFWYTEGRVLLGSDVVLTSNCGADCEKPAANPYKRNRRTAGPRSLSLSSWRRCARSAPAWGWCGWRCGSSPNTSPACASTWRG